MGKKFGREELERRKALAAAEAAGLDTSAFQQSAPQASALLAQAVGVPAAVAPALPAAALPPALPYLTALAPLGLYSDAPAFDAEALRARVEAIAQLSQIETANFNRLAGVTCQFNVQGSAALADSLPLDGASGTCQVIEEKEQPGGSVDRVQALLISCGLANCLPAFVRQGFDTIEALELMNEGDMQDCGIGTESVLAFRQGLREWKAKNQKMSYVADKRGGVGMREARGGSLSVKDLIAEHVATLASTVFAPPAPKPNLAQELLLKSAKLAQPTPVQPPSVTWTETSRKELQATAVSHNPAEQLLLRVGQPDSLGSLNGTRDGSAAVGRAADGARTKLPQEVAKQLGEIPADGPHATLYSYVQMAQEAAEYGANAATLAGKTQDLAEASQLADAAEQAAGRARWAAIAAMEYESPLGEDDTMVASIRQVTQQAFEQAVDAAEKASAAKKLKDPEEVIAIAKAKEMNERLRGGKRQREACQNFRDGICHKGSECTYSHDPKDQEKIQPRKKTRVPCMNFKKGTCSKTAENCPFSHNPEDEKPRPLWEKRPFNCQYWLDGNCIRGQSCAFAHGDEELDMVKKFKVAMRRSTGQFS